MKRLGNSYSYSPNSANTSAFLVSRFENLNDLLLPGYLPMETRFYRMPNGRFFVALRTEFMNATSDMINWWFDWHAKESLRYRIWFPEAHYGISMKDSQKQRPDALRHWHTTHFSLISKV